MAANGSALAYAEGNLWLFQPDGTPLLVTDEISPDQPFSARAALNDAGDRVVYQQTFTNCRLLLTTPSAGLGGSETVMVSADAVCTLEAMSSDGSTVLFISPGNFDGSNGSGPFRARQAWTVDTSSGAIKAVTHDPASVSAATLSNDGNIVWVATFGGRILPIERSTGATQEIIPQTIALDQPWYWDQMNPRMDFVPLRGAPGALLRVTGSGLALGPATSTIPLGTALAGLQVLLDCQPAPLLSVSPKEIVVQIPWEATTGPHTLSLPDTASPFAGLRSRSLGLSEIFAQFWPNSDGSRSVIHQDFSGPVTAQNPARPGEILHLYVTGLGAVIPSVADGQPGPLDPLSTVESPVSIAWYAENYTPEMTGVLFAGLAPGLVGIEQVDVQVPNALRAPAGNLVQMTVSFGPVGTTVLIQP